MPIDRSLCSPLLATLLAFGCGDGGWQPDTTSQAETLSHPTRQPNGTGIHVGSTQPESWFGLADTSLTWFMSGFLQRADGSYLARGWYSIDLALLPADAPITGAELNGTAANIEAIRTSGTQLSIDLRNSQGGLQTLKDSGLVGLTLVLRVPDPLGLTRRTYRLRFTSAESVDSQFGDVYGYRLEYLIAGSLLPSWSSYCKGPNGEPQRSIFYQGAHWNPLNGARTDGSNLLTLTCESGSVAQCMRWGYRPWASATGSGGQEVSLVDYHQACIHMKRASYCGDSRANTMDGTLISIQDPLTPAINTGSLDKIEALWTPSGAACLNQRRHPEMLFLGCASPLPTCTADKMSSFLLASGIVSQN